MKKVFIAILCGYLLTACNGHIKESDPSTKNAEDEAPTTPANAKPTAGNKKLLYMYAVNAGLIGFFSDSSVAACPKCDLCQENVNSMYTIEPFATYHEYPDFLVVRIGERNDTMIFRAKGKNSKDWPMVSGQWIRNPEICK